MVELQIVLVVPDWFEISIPGIDQIKKCTDKLQQEDRLCGCGLVGDLLIAETSELFLTTTPVLVAM